MRAWQSRGGEVRTRTKRDFNVDEHVQGLALLLSQSAPYWREIGRRRPLVAQFTVPGDPRSSWFVQVDGAGGEARIGEHASPTVTWESDLDAMRSAFAGRLLPGRVRVIGDFEQMRSLFAAIAQTSLS